MIYEWDEGKRDANMEKHGVDFAAVEGFDWGTAMIEQDALTDYRETR